MPKGLDEMRAEALRSAVERIRETHPEFRGRGGQTRLAEKIGISGAHFSNFINGKTGAGIDFVEKFRASFPDEVDAEFQFLPRGPERVRGATESGQTAAPPGHVPVVVIDVIEQLIEMGWEPRNVTATVRGLRFQHDRPPTHLEIFNAALHHLRALEDPSAAPPIEARPSVDLSAKTPEEKALRKERAAQRRAARRGNESSDELTPKKKRK